MGVSVGNWACFKGTWGVVWWVSRGCLKGVGPMGLSVPMGLVGLLGLVGPLGLMGPLALGL